MGLFSNKKETIVNTTVQRVFEDTQIPDSIKTGVIKSILAEGELSDFMMEELASSLGVRTARGYLWAKNNNYSFGIPTAQVASVVQAKNIVLSTIASEINQAITTDYYKFGPMNTIHYGWTWLMLNAGYNPQTNELTAQSSVHGFPCYLTNMVATYPQADFDFMQVTQDFEMLAQWGPAPSSGFTPTNPFNYLGGIGQYASQSQYVVSPTATEDSVTITYEYKNAAGVIVRNSLVVYLAAELEDDYHQVRYRRADGVYGFWSYREGAGLYPDIDGAYAMDFNDLGTYLPWCYFRLAGERIKDSDPTGYTQATKWAKYLGVTYDTIDDGVHEDPDVDDVEQALMLFGVLPSAQSQAELTYLFEYFNILHFNSLSQAQLADNLSEKFGVYSNSASQLQVIQDRVFKMTFQFSGITKKRVPGKIAAVGKFTGTYEQLMPGGTGQQLQSAYVYRKQVMDSMYEEVAVFGLKVNYQITSKKGFSANGDDPELLIPVDRTLLSSLSMRNKEQLLARSLHMVVNTKVTIKSPWYASTIFRVVLIIIAVVITILSAGTAWASIVAAASIGYVALAITVLTIILSSIAISYATKLFVKEFGPKVGFIAAVAAMAYGAYSGAGMTGSSTWAESMVAVGNNLASSAAAAQDDMLKDINQEIIDFQEYAKGQFDSMEEQREQLGLKTEFSGLSGLDFVTLSPMQVWGETPNDLYARTVHSGNIGAASFDVASGYANFMLQLPTIKDLPLPEEGSTNGVPVD